MCVFVCLATPTTTRTDRGQTLARSGKASWSGIASRDRAKPCGRAKPRGDADDGGDECLFLFPAVSDDSHISIAITSRLQLVRQASSLATYYSEWGKPPSRYIITGAQPPAI